MTRQPRTRDADVGSTRRARCRTWYFESADASLHLAESFHEKAESGSDGLNHFTAYMYLFVAFNNLYNWYAWGHARAGDSQQKKIKAVVRSLTDQAAREIYTPQYVERILDLNVRQPKQLDDAERDMNVQGVLNMDEYFRGGRIPSCLARLQDESIATTEDAPTQQRETIAELAATLLYTVRNNQFHAVKGVIDADDREVLEMAYALLHPISLALLNATYESTG